MRHRLALGTLTLALLAGCSSTQPEAADPTRTDVGTAVGSTTADSSTTAASTTTSTTASAIVETTTVSTTAVSEFANRSFPIGDEDFDEIYRLLDGIRNEAARTNDLELHDSAVGIRQSSQDLEAQIGAGEQRVPADNYTIDDVQPWLHPADDTVVLIVTDTRDGPIEWADSAGEVTRTLPPRSVPTLKWVVTMRRDPTGVWTIIDDVPVGADFGFTDDELAAGPTETLTVGDSAVSTWKNGDGLCVVYPAPAAVFCIPQSEVDGWRSNPAIAIRWRFWRSSLSSVLIVLTATPDPDDLPGIEVLANQETLDSAIFADGFLVAVDPRSLPDDEIGILGPSRVINTVGVAGDG